MTTTYEAELASALHEEFARRRRPTRGRTTETRPAVALLQNERDRARRAPSPIGRHCGFCGAPVCECGLDGYVT